MGVKAQHLGFLHGCWPSEEVPMRSRHSASETGTLGSGSPVLSAVSVERDVTWGHLAFGWYSLVYRVTYQASFLSRCDSELFR